MPFWGRSENSLFEQCQYQDYKRVFRIENKTLTNWFGIPRWRSTEHICSFIDLFRRDNSNNTIYTNRRRLSIGDHLHHLKRWHCPTWLMIFDTSLTSCKYANRMHCDLFRRQNILSVFYSIGIDDNYLLTTSINNYKTCSLENSLYNYSVFTY